MKEEKLSIQRLQILLKLKKSILCNNNIIDCENYTIEELYEKLMKYEIFQLIERIDPFSLTKLKNLIKQTNDWGEKIKDNTDFTAIRKTELGQYFTEKELINKIYTNLELTNKKETITILDPTAGIGAFIQPLAKYKHSIPYAVEVDPVAYSLMLYNLILVKELPKERQRTLLLCLKKGDAIKGWNKKELIKIKKNKQTKEKLDELIELRKNILWSKNYTLSDVKYALDLQKELEKEAKGFNWFIEFPETFEESNGFDYIIGNPPWLSYKNNHRKTYQEIFIEEPFAGLLHGKFNFALPFLILSIHLTKEKGSMIVPKGILSERYSIPLRRTMIKRKLLESIELLENKHFRKVNNEYCIVSWNKKPNAKKLIFKYSENQNYALQYSEIREPVYLLPIMPKHVRNELNQHFFTQPKKMADVCKIRRGLTLTRKYQREYVDAETKEDRQMKKIIKHNHYSIMKKEGVYNYQLFYAGDTFYYDKKLLGAAGSEELFENPKIIRRNRGREWQIGLDAKGAYYVNDIFDVIIPTKKENCSLFMLYGYLSTSLIQYFTENHFLRDITSNFVRAIPIVKLNAKEKKEVEKAVEIWLHSAKKLEDFKSMREKTDEVFYSKLNIAEDVKEYMTEHTKTVLDARWKT